jgi:hypothetical protein
MIFLVSSIYPVLCPGTNWKKPISSGTVFTVVKTGLFHWPEETANPV